MTRTTDALRMIENLSKVANTSKPRLLGIDLFSGAGGMSLGAVWSGIQVITAVEADTHAAATFSLNHPATKMLNQRIENVKNLSVERKNDDRLVVFGGPPCQGFSTSNQRTRGSANPTNWLFREYLRLVSLTSPDWVVFENVTGLSITEDGRFLDSVIRGLKRRGYAVEQMILDASQFGVPQKRSRLFLVASLHNEKFKRPVPQATRITVSQALSDLPILRNGATTDRRSYRIAAKTEYACLMRGDLGESSNHLVTNNAPYVIDRFKHVPPGGNWSAIPASKMTNYADPTRCHTGIYKRLNPNEPSVVIGNFRKNMLIHPTQNRGLSVREAARLQSFPDSFAFLGSIGFQQQQVGNAVPPLLAKSVFESIL